MPNLVKINEKFPKRKYMPLTHKKRLPKGKKKLELARRKLTQSRNFVISRAELYFQTMSEQASNFQKLCKETCIPWQSYQRLTASRVFYVFQENEPYRRSRQVKSKPESLEAEAFVLDILQSRGFEIATHIRIFHPILFFISCVPNGICRNKTKMFLLEVKALFFEEGIMKNEMNEVFDETQGLEKWKKQVQFSLGCGEFESGLLVLFDYENKLLFKK